MTDLAPLTLPAADAGTDAWSAWLTTRTTDQLDSARGLIAALKAERPRDASVLLERWNDIGLALSNAFAAGSLLQQVHPDAALREQAEAAEVEAHRLLTDLSLDREVYDLLVVDDAEQRTSGLDDDAERVRNFALRDFRRSGVDRDEATRDRVRAINERETELGQTFERHIRDDDTTVKLRPEQLAGLPQDWVESHPVGEDGLVELTLEYPDVVPMLTFATDRDARVTVATAFNNRAWPANDDVLVELMALRQEHATLLGYDGWPAYDAEVKMIETGDAIAAFIDKISKAAESSAIRDRDVLLARIRQDRPEAETLDAADTRFYTEAIKREQHSVDAQEVRRYFAFDQVRQGLLDVTGRLFGLGYERVDAPTWHEDVTSYDVSAGRRADRPDPPRPAPARRQVQPRRTVHARRRCHRAPAARGRAGVQLPARADGARRRRHAVPRVRPPRPPRPRRPPALVAVRRRRHRVGLRRGAVTAARGVGLGRDRPRGLRHRRGRDADPGRPGRADARGRGVRQGPAGAHPDVLRGAVLPDPSGAADRRRRDRGPVAAAAGGVLDGRHRCPTPTSTRRSGTSTATRRATTPTCGRW